MSNKYVALIPARGGSKSIPLKNIKIIAGKPLIQWTIEAAVNCCQIDEVYLATDSEAVTSVAQTFNYKKLKVIGRSPETATDTASTESVMLEFANEHEFENLILIQATSPLMNSEDLEKAIEKYEKNKADSLLSVTEQKRFIWEIKDNDFVIPKNYNPQFRPRRQDFNGFLVENGAFYITKKDRLLESNCRLSGQITHYKMPEETYYEIDEPEDWVIVEKLLQLNKVKDSVVTKDVKLFLTDVDGVLTDAGMYYSENGDELKKFNTHDGKGIELLRNRGIKTGIVTSENTKLNEKRAKKLKCDHIFQGVKDKLSLVTDICHKENISLDEVAYIGDDINDIELLSSVGIAACPANALPGVKSLTNIICLKKKGGDGAVREFVEMIIKN
ncbi:MAG: HAD hydrolase family protein [Methanolobus sp.]